MLVRKKCQNSIQFITNYKISKIYLKFGVKFVVFGIRKPSQLLKYLNAQPIKTIAKIAIFQNMFSKNDIK